jgi:NhaA family Na+:H+ antiporter
METQLHPWSAYLVLPLFALANADVPVSLGALGDALGGPVGLGIFLGLVVGAPLGGFVLAWVLSRVSAARLSHGLDWPAIAGVAPLKGIGFTVAIFISELAFTGQVRDQAKLAILVASVTAGVAGVAILLLRSGSARF